MIVWKNGFLAQLMVFLMILSLLSPTKSFAQDDFTPPTLNSFTVSTKEVIGGDIVKITSDVTDNLSGVKWVYF